jgi:hypothetical protein
MVYGTVTDSETGKALEYVWVDVYNPEYGAYNDTMTDGDGYYEMSVFEGEWEIAAYTEDYYGFEDAYTVGKGKSVRVDISMEPLPPKTSKIFGWVNDSDTGGAVAGAEINVFDDNYDFWDYTETDSTGYYEVDVWEGSFNVECPPWQWEEGTKRYAGYVTVADVGFEEEYLLNISLHEHQRSHFNNSLTFDGWNLVSYSMVETMYDEEAYWFRYMLDGNEDGTVSAAEVKTFETMMAGMATSETTESFFLTDDIYYDAITGTSNCDITGAEGPTASTDPITLELSVQLQSHENIQPKLSHTIELNVSYNDGYSENVYYVELPSGSSMDSSDSSGLVEVSGDQTVVIVPDEDPDPDDEEYGEWVTITAS